MNTINTIMIIDAITMLLPRSPHNPPNKQVWHLSFKVCGKKDNLIKSKPELHQLELNLTRNSWFRTSQRFQCTIVRCQRKEKSQNTVICDMIIYVKYSDTTGSNNYQNFLIQKLLQIQNNAFVTKCCNVALMAGL